MVYLRGSIKFSRKFKVSIWNIYIIPRGLGRFVKCYVLMCYILFYLNIYYTVSSRIIHIYKIQKLKIKTYLNSYLLYRTTHKLRFTYQ